MDDFMQLVVEGVIARLAGPMSFRFMLQPTVAIILGFRDGRLDAKAGTPPLIFDLIFRPADRARAFKSALGALSLCLLILPVRGSL